MSGGTKQAESNLGEIAAKIYSKPPQQPCTIELGLAESDAANGDVNERVFVLFEILLELLLEGIKVKFGEGKSPAHLTVAETEEIGRYVQSYGFVMIIRSDEIRNAPPVTDAEGKPYLKDHCHRFYDFELEMWHEVSFDFVNKVLS